MHTCSNCKAEFNGANEGVVVSSKILPVTAICDACMTNARLIKLVLRRGDIGSFTYEQFSVIETVGGMSSAKRTA
jgi:thymidine kinase